MRSRPGRFRGRSRSVLVFLVVSAATFPAGAASGDIDTFAGGGVGDRGPATAGVLRAPWGITQDADGNLYIAETFGHRIRKIVPGGAITTVTGTGESRSSGDGGAAVLAGVWEPIDVAFGPDGALFVAESSGHRVRRIGTDGIIGTVAGNGVYSGPLGDGGPATAAPITPRSITLDGAGNLYIGEAARVRRVDAVTGFITTVAGTGTFLGPLGDGGPAVDAAVGNVDGLALDPAGNLYLSDNGHSRVRRVDAVTHVITTVIGDGEDCCFSEGKAATQTSINPGGLDFDPDGNLVLAAYYVVVKMDARSGRMSLVAGNGSPNSLTNFRENWPARATYLRDVKDVIVHPIGIVFTDIAATPIVRSVDSLGLIHTVAGNATFLGDGGPATSGYISGPGDAAADSDGNVYVADTGHNLIRKIDPSGTITTFAGGGAGLPGTNFGDGGPATSATLDRPYGVDVDGSGNVYVADTFHQRIRKVDPGGTITTVAGPFVPGTGDELGFGRQGIGWTFDVAVAPDGRVFIAALEHVWRLDPSGAVTAVAGNGGYGLSGDDGPATEAQLREAQGVAVDGAGNVFIADTYNHRIRRVDAATGIITTVAGSGPTGPPGGNCYPDPTCGDGKLATLARLAVPTGVDVAVDGSLYIADTRNHRIRVVGPDGVIDGVAGITNSYWGGFFGDGGPPPAAALNNPRAIALTSLGLLISDSGNNRLRLIAA